jgi:hypothetical protein
MNELIAKYLEEAHHRKGQKKHQPQLQKKKKPIKSKTLTRPKTHTPPTPVAPNAKLKLSALAKTLAASPAPQGPEDFLASIADALGGKMDDPEKTQYFSNLATGQSLILRLANHRGNASTFAGFNELAGNIGIVLKMQENRFKSDSRVEYVENVFFPDKLTVEKESGIALGLAAWVEKGKYTGPEGDETNISQNNTSGTVTEEKMDADEDVQIAISDTQDQPTNISSHVPLRIDPSVGQRSATPDNILHEIEESSSPARFFRSNHQAPSFLSPYRLLYLYKRVMNENDSSHVNTGNLLNRNKR